MNEKEANAILSIVNDHLSSLERHAGEHQSMYMQGYLKACRNIVDILHAYLKAVTLGGDSND